VEHSSRIVELAATTPLVVNTRSGRTTGVGLRRRRLLIEEVGAFNPSRKNKHFLHSDIKHEL
jgi:hypothetical protein